VAALVSRGDYVKADPIPPQLVEAAADVADALGLPANWLNPGPTSMVDTGFPEGFASRVEVRHYGGLTLHIASRYDQIFLKLYAAADQSPGSKHADDLRRSHPRGASGRGPLDHAAGSLRRLPFPATQRTIGAWGRGC
jgi:hypothetical protein